jgi:hypothetical protein
VKRNHKITWKEFGTRRSRFGSYFRDPDNYEVKVGDWVGSWPNQHIGRWWKRQLSKARRRYIKHTLRGIRSKEPTGYESVVNWRTW